jgi:glycosyltransferase involved in cell wall biosynthesis
LTGKYPQLLYEIIDDGPERSHLAALARELKIAERVKFFGRQNRQFIAEAMKRCTIFALPSRDEAMGCVYLEAMATGKPIVGCHGQGIEEIVRHGENGWLIQPDNLQELVKALDTFLGDASLRKQLGVEARKTIIERLTLRHQAAHLSQLYRECLRLAVGS